MLQQRARLGASVDTPFPLAFLRLQAPVDLPSTDAQQLFLHRRGHPVALANPRHPVRQQGLQPHRPGISRGFPNRRQYGEYLRALARSASLPPSLRLLSGRSSIQNANRVFPVVAAVQAKFVQHPVLRFSPCLVIPLIHCPEVFPLRLVSQSPPSSKLPLRRVTSYVSRQPPLGLHLAWLDTQNCISLPWVLVSEQLALIAWRLDHVG
jgi:hypothetical protein